MVNYPTNEIIIDGYFQSKNGGIARDYHFIRSELFPTDTQKLEYLESGRLKLDGKTIAINWKIAKIKSLLNHPIHLDKISANKPFWFSQIPPYNMKERKVIDFVRVHDLFPITNPEWYPAKQHLIFKQNIKNIGKNTQLIAISEYTADRFSQILGVHKDNILVYPCSQNSMSKIKCGVCQGCNFKYQSRYLLSVGTIEPRKNFQFLLDLWTEHKINHDLIIVGKPGWKTYKLQQRLRKNISNVKWLSEVCDGALSELYEFAIAYISPSFDEGFNIPVSEANSYSKFLILSDIPVHKELFSDTAFFFNHKNKSQLVDLLKAFS